MHNIFLAFGKRNKRFTIYLVVPLAATVVTSIFIVLCVYNKIWWFHRRVDCLFAEQAVLPFSLEGVCLSEYYLYYTII